MSDKPNFSSLYRPQHTELATAKRNKVDYAQRLAEIQDHIRRLQAEEEDLEASLYHCDRILAPFRLVPNDVLHEIFTRCLHPEKEIAVKLSHTQAPLLLMHVCRRWRIVATECAVLWKYIHISVQEDTGVGVARMNHMADILVKSASSPFNLRITWPNDRFLRNDFFIRVGQSITGLGLRRIPIVTLISLPSGLFPRLERLYIHCSRSSGWEQFRSLHTIQAFAGSPCLRQVALTSWFFEGKTDSAAIRIALPWPQLTHIYNQEGHDSMGVVSYFMHHLPQSTNLRYLRFSVPENANRDFDSTSTISLFNLEGLCMDFEDQYHDYSLQFLRKLNFPNLKFLCLEGGECLPPASYSSDQYDELQMKMSSLSSLVRLSIQFSEMAAIMFKLFLQCAPNTEILDANIGLCPGGADNHPLKQLEWGSPPDARLLPRLHTLILRPWVFDSSRAGDHFDCIIRSRMNHGLPEERLRKAVIYTETHCRVNRDVVQEYVDLGTLEFEEHLVEDEEEEDAYNWMKDDPALHDWFEIQP